MNKQGWLTRSADDRRRRGPGPGVARPAPATSPQAARHVRPDAGQHGVTSSSPGTPDEPGDRDGAGAWLRRSCWPAPRRLAVALAAAAPARRTSRRQCRRRATVDRAIDRRLPGRPRVGVGAVAAEDERLIEVRTVGSLASWTQNPLKSALPARHRRRRTRWCSPPRTRALHDRRTCSALAPQTFVRQPDGVLPAARRTSWSSPARRSTCADPGGLRLLLASDPKGFVSIVNYGGRLNIAGAHGRAGRDHQLRPRSTEAPDRLTDDGRAYLRSIGGQVSIAQHRAVRPRVLERPDRRAVADRHRPAQQRSLVRARPTRSKVGRAWADRRAAGGGAATGNSTAGPGAARGRPAGPDGRRGRARVQLRVGRDQRHHGHRQRLRPLRRPAPTGSTSAAARSTTASSPASSCTATSSTRSIEQTQANGNAQDGIVLARATTGIVLSEVDRATATTATG